MNDCDATRRLLSAYVDGELLAEDRQAVDRHLSGCEACLSLLLAEEALADSIRQALPLPEAPAELRARVQELLVSRRAPLRRRAARMAAAAAVVVLAAGTWAGVSGRFDPPTPAEAAAFVHLATDSHLRYADGRLPLEIMSSDPVKVANWFDGRVPFHVALPAYPLAPGERNPYEMAGGRLVSFAGEYAAFVGYRLEDSPISLLVASSGAVRPAGPDVVKAGKLLFHVEERDGLKVITWTDNGLTYALVSDVAVEGAASCVVCHGSPSERRHLEGFGPKT